MGQRRWFLFAVFCALLSACSAHSAAMAGGMQGPHMDVASTSPAMMSPGMEEMDAGIARDRSDSGELAMLGPAPGRPATRNDASGGRPSAAGSTPSGAAVVAVAPTLGEPALAASAEALKPVAPLLIYTATLALSVFEVAQSLDKVFAVAQELGGYLVGRTNTTMTFRVPAESYREALTAIAKIGDVVDRNETVQDVTDQFRDLETQLKNARTVRARLEQLMAQAKDVTEALMVEEQLGRVTGQIEAIEGKLKRMRELIRFSTITVQFRPIQVQRITPRVRLPFDWLDSLGLSRLLSL
ncbi:MAG: DUF4349 domain-containing protein [Myxococcales bacterium]|nr:DUF4349 domain-containing protein [Myxococcales bacterium]